MNKELLDWVGNTYNDYEKSIIKSYKDHGLEGFEYLNKENFIERIKNDAVFAEKWGVTVTHTELTTNERMDYWFKNNKPNRDVCDTVDELPPSEKEEYFNDVNIPKKLIKLTYNNNSIDVYE